MKEAQIVTQTLSDGSSTTIRLERIEDNTVEFTIARDMAIIDTTTESGEDEITSTFRVLQVQYFGKIIEKQVSI